MAASAFERLLRVLELEERQGWRNRAVIGGLQAMAARWQKDAAQEEADPRVVSTVIVLMERYQVGNVEVRVAHTGPSGVEEARRFRPEVVVCDIGLPGMDGYAVAAELRRERTVPALLIALSGYGQEEDIRRGEAAGFQCYLTKPVDPGELERLLAEPGSRV